MKTVVFTDVHGCLGEMEQLLRKCGLDEAEDRLIFLGDMMDRGPDCRGVYQRLVELKERMGGRFTLILGNHEDMLLHAFTDGVVWNRWMRNRGDITLNSFKKYGETAAVTFPFVRQMRPYLETERFVCAHAGLVQENPADNTLHDLIWDRRLAEGAPYHGRLLLYGHTSAQQAVYRDEAGNGRFLEADVPFPLPEKGSICLDTGCVYGCRLSALVIEGDTAVVRTVESGNKKGYCD